jgi:hypothetical protein
VGAGRIAVPIGMQIILLVCVGMTIWLGLYPPNVLEWANRASQELLLLMS